MSPAISLPYTLNAYSTANLALTHRLVGHIGVLDEPFTKGTGSVEAWLRNISLSNATGATWRPYIDSTYMKAARPFVLPSPSSQRPRAASHPDTRPPLTTLQLVLSWVPQLRVEQALPGSVFSGLEKALARAHGVHFPYSGALAYQVLLALLMIVQLADDRQWAQNWTGMTAGIFSRGCDAMEHLVHT